MEPKKNKLIRNRSFEKRQRFINNDISLFRPQFDSQLDITGHGLKTAKSQAKIWQIMEKYLPSDVKTIQKQFCDHLEYTLARTRFDFDLRSAHRALAFSMRDRILELWNDTQRIITI